MDKILHYGTTAPPHNFNSDIIDSYACAWKLLDLDKSKQGNTTNLNIFFFMENKKDLFRWDLNPQHTAYEADALPNELLRQLSWLGIIKALQGKGNQSNLT